MYLHTDSQIGAAKGNQCIRWNNNNSHQPYHSDPGQSPRRLSNSGHLQIELTAGVHVMGSQ